MCTFPSFFFTTMDFIDTVHVAIGSIPVFYFKEAREEI